MLIVASIRNELGATLRVHGLCARDAATCAPIDVPPGQTREVRFASGRAGTYHYWATTMGAPVPFREMGGAFIVDPRGGPLAPDRVFVITEWSSLTPQQLRAVLTADDSGAAFASLQPGVAFMINGLSWPATERLTYQARQIGPLASHQPELAGAPHASARLLLRGRQPRGRRSRRAGRCPDQAPGRDRAAAIRRDDGVDVAAGAGGQLAVSLPHHAPRLARAASLRGRALWERTTVLTTVRITAATTLARAWPE